MDRGGDPRKASIETVFSYLQTDELNPAPFDSARLHRNRPRIDALDHHSNNKVICCNYDYTRFLANDQIQSDVCWVLVYCDVKSRLSVIHEHAIYQCRQLHIPGP